MKLLTIILTLFSFTTFAQVTNKIPEYIFNNRLGVGTGGLAGDTTVYLHIGPNAGAVKGVKLPVVTDTAAVAGLKKQGLTIFSVQLNTPLYWDSINSRWKQMGGSLQHAPGTGDSLLFTAGNYLRLIQEEYGIVTTQYTNEVAWKVDTSVIPTRYSIDSLGQLIVANFESASIYNGLPSSDDTLVFWRNDSTAFIKTPVPGYGLLSDASVRTDTTMGFLVDTATLRTWAETFVGGSTIYNSDDALTDNRTVDIGNNFLYFSGDKNFQVLMRPWTYDYEQSQIFFTADADTSYDSNASLNISTGLTDSRVEYSSSFLGNVISTDYISTDVSASIINNFTGRVGSVTYYHTTGVPDSVGLIFPISPSTNTGLFALAHDTTTGQIVRIPMSGGGGGITTLAAIGSSPNANGATISGSTLNLEPASASFGGVITTGTQTIAGVKSFTNNITIADINIGTGNLTDSTNTVFGVNAFSSAAGSMSASVAIGFEAIKGLNSGSADENTAVGYYAMRANGGGSAYFNTAVGARSMVVITDGQNNTGLGHSTLSGLTNGDYNVSIGYSTLTGITTGNNNTAIGSEAGNNGNISGGVFIGSNAGNGNATSNSLFIDNSSTATPLIHGNFSADTLRFNGAVSIRDVDSTSSPMNMLFITKEGRIMKAAVPSGGGGGIDSTAAYSDHYFLANALGSNIKFQSLGRSISEATGANALADGTQRFVAVYVRKQTTITGVKWFQGAQGDYTADNYNGVGLYAVNASTGDITLVASSTDDGNIWKAAASTISSKAFSSTYVADPGVYYISFLYNSSSQTTAPTLAAYAAMSTGISAANWSNSLKLNSQLGSRTSLIASTTGASTTAVNNAHWAALY